MKFSKELLVIAFSAAVTLAQDDGPKFRVYGFADATVSKCFMKDNAFIQAFNIANKNVNISLDHINIYNDFNPNDHVRMLLELGYNSYPVFQNNAVGKVLRIAGMPDTVIEVSQELPANTIKKRVASYEWGSFSVERALFQLKLNQYFNLSIGKFITPAGIWNVDHGSPVIMTVRQPTEFSIAEIFPKSQFGIMNEGRIFMGDADLGYSLYLSSGRENVELESARDIAVGGQARISLPAFDEMRLGISGYTGLYRSDLTTMYITVDQTKIDLIQTEKTNSILANQTLMGSYQQLATSQIMAENPTLADPVILGQLIQQRIGVFVTDTITKLVTSQVEKETENMDNYSYVTTHSKSSRERVFGADFRTKIKKVGLQGEINIQRVYNFKKNDAVTTVSGMYGLISFDAIKKEDFALIPYVCLERIRLKDDANNPYLYLAGNVNGYNTYMFGLNSKIYSNFGVKIEFCLVDLKTQGVLSPYQKLSDFNVLSVQFNVGF